MSYGFTEIKSLFFCICLRTYLFNFLYRILATHFQSVKRLHENSTGIKISQQSHLKLGINHTKAYLRSESCTTTQKETLYSLLPICVIQGHKPENTLVWNSMNVCSKTEESIHKWISTRIWWTELHTVKGKCIQTQPKTSSDVTKL